MKKKLASVIIVLCLIAALLPVAGAQVTPYFIAVNDTLLPFADENMPLYSSGIIFVPHKVFAEMGVFAYSSVEAERIMLNQGSRYIDFYTAEGVTIDQDGNVRNWPSARRIGNIFYLPLDSVCNYFGLTYRPIELDYDIIPNAPISVIRIISKAILNDETFVGMNKTKLQNYYNDYYNINQGQTGPGQSSGPAQEPTQSPPVPPSYKDVTIYLSFYDLAAGSAGKIMDSLDAQAVSSFRSCFFVSADDIRQSPALVRRISGSGHTIGIWLGEGTLEEYLEASALLFEAAKVKTVIVSANEAGDTARRTAETNGLIFRESSYIYDSETDASADSIAETLPTERGERRSYSFSCSENTSRLLPDLLSHLRTSDYTVARITETTARVTTD